MMRDLPLVTPEQAWPAEKRLADMQSIIATLAVFGEPALRQIKPRMVAETYRVPLAAVELEIFKHREAGEGK